MDIKTQHKYLVMDSALLFAFSLGGHSSVCERLQQATQCNDAQYD